MTTTTGQTTLAELINTKRGDRTYAKLSRDCGGAPTDKRLQSMVSRPMKAFPDADTIKGLAIGLRVNAADVILASARSLGLNVEASDTVGLNIPGAGALPDSAKEAIIGVAMELLKIHNTTGAQKAFTEYQAQLRQDFTASARLRRVPAVEIEDALQGPGWYAATADDDSAAATDMILGSVEGTHARQLKAALRDVLAEGVELTQDAVALASSKKHKGIDPGELEHTS